MKVEIRRIGINDAPIVQKVYEASPGYFRLVDGSDVKPDFAEKDILDCVPKEKQSPQYEKIFCLLLWDSRPIGIVDLHNHHPEKEIVYLGLLILDERMQKKGLGKLCFDATEKYIRDVLKSPESDWEWPNKTMWKFSGRKWGLNEMAEPMSGKVPIKRITSLKWIKFFNFDDATHLL